MRQSAENPAASSFAARLRSVTQNHGGASALARVIQRSEGAVRKWLRGESEPNVSDLRAICLATATDVGWLVTGDGECEALALRDSAPRYANNHDLPPDYALLHEIMDSVERELASVALELPATKRSAIVVTLYQLFRAGKTIDAQAVTRLVSLTRQ